MLRTLAMSLILTTAVAAPAHAAGPAGWDHPGYDAEDSYYNPGESTINVGTIAHLTRRWSAPIRQHEGACGGTSSPLLIGDRLVTTDELGISAYEARTGVVAWRYDWSDPDDSSTPAMAVSGGVLIAANGDCHSMSDPNGTLTALDVATGRVRWKHDLDTPIYSAVVDKNVAVVSGESPSDELITLAYRTSDGHLMWSKPGYTGSSVAANGRILLTKSTTTAAVEVTTGAVLWTKPRLWRAESATPASDRFLVTDGTALTAVNAATGAVAWTAPGKAADLMATDGRRVYRSADHTIEALSAATGGPLWSRQLPATSSQPIRAGGLLYTSGAVLNAASGVVAYPGTPFAGKQIITGGRLYTVNGSTLSSYAP